jgi:tetratricopeptide (TPR) repeat protein
MPEGHRALGSYYYYGFRGYDRALEQYAIAAETLTNDADLRLSIFALYRRQGRWDEALEALGKLQRIDPQGYVTAVEAAITYSLLREFDRAEQEMRRQSQLLRIERRPIGKRAHGTSCGGMVQQSVHAGSWRRHRVSIHRRSITFRSCLIFTTASRVC